ncbi:FecR domain-containing protein [Sphingomonas sp. QA11]|uniref:FecR family protein n=1 Tax=Sphingomonas sp. QA11 TaxID=2950605 RepID=UPI00234B0A03|nr:FecR domain-containing protein [Sphingomonas sp. QA11]WCM25928.1 FecR domain-containing protein [Sphingomonas sp. QA11]
MKEEGEPEPSQGQLRDEAAEWFAIMRGPEAEARCDEFNQWLARGALHRRAYNSVAEIFNFGKLLKGAPSTSAEQTNPRGGPASDRKPSRGKLFLGLLAASGVGLSLVALTTHLGGRAGSRVPDAVASGGTEIQYGTGVGEIRDFALSDGSRLSLDTNSLVLASYTARERGLRLMNGRARFYVAHERRPFLVRADTAVVTAHGTIFDVALLPARRVAIHLVQGAVDVRSQPDSSLRPAGTARVLPAIFTRMVAGERLLVDSDGATPRPGVPIGDENWPQGVEAFNDVPLSQLLDAANRYTSKPISVATAEIGALRVSGTFHLRETQRIAENIADLLALAVTYEDSGYTLSRRCVPKIGIRCRPPS